MFILAIVALFGLQGQSEYPARNSEQVKEWRREREEKLEQRKDIEKQRNLVAQKEQGVLQRLQQIESEWLANEKELAKYRKEAEETRRMAEKLLPELEALRNKNERYKKLVSLRIRAIYKLGYRGKSSQALKALLSAENITDLLHKRKYMKAIADADGSMLNQLESQQHAILRTNSELLERIRLTEVASKAVEEKRKDILEQRREREALLHQYRTQKETYDRTLKELKAAVAELEKLLGVVNKESIAGVNGVVPNMRGKLPIPVAGKTVPNQTTADRGLTIRAEKGTPVRCVADGVVARTVESIVGYGNTILVAHGNGYISVYAHLSEILVTMGETVKANQVIGKVGDTGSLIGDVLYFELWHNYDRLNTREWLER
jgi:murein DD-endopeptidase MepM/ murein hydrolase activator NlpD